MVQRVTQPFRLRSARNLPFPVLAVAGSTIVAAACRVAVGRHVYRHDRSGFLLVVLASLLRPESWPALLVSGMVLWRRRPGSRALVLAAVAAVPVLWFGGDYLGSGDPFRGGQL